MALTAQAPAKINLGLHVLRKRPDGYHDIETVFHRVDWVDTITAEPADRLSLTCSDPELPTDEQNLCLQAAHRLREAFDVNGGARLHLEKRIPYGAGLGGGSSDAAATLQLLRRLWEVSATPQQLREIAQEIGADVSFFLGREPAAYATGRGDDLTPLYRDGDPYRLPFPVLIAVPPVEVETPWAYRQVTPGDTNRPALPDLIRANDLASWQTRLTNDFEAPIVEAFPAVAVLRERLAVHSDVYVSLSGSGGAVYAVFPSRELADEAQKRVQGDRIRTHLQYSAE